MKDYFTRKNVVAVLTLLFASAIYFENDFVQTSKSILDQYQIEHDSFTSSIEQLENSYKILIFAKDSLKDSSSRISKYGNFISYALDNPRSSQIAKAIELKREVQDDIAKFSKFDHLKINQEFGEAYSLENQYLQGEKTLTDAMHRYAIAVESKLDKNKTSGLYAEMESDFIQLESINKKVLEKNLLFESSIPSLKNKSQKKNSDFRDRMENEKILAYKSLIIASIMFFLWIVVFIFAIKFESFKKKNIR